MTCKGGIAMTSVQLGGIRISVFEIDFPGLSRDEAFEKIKDEISNTAIDVFNEDGCVRPMAATYKFLDSDNGRIMAFMLVHEFGEFDHVAKMTMMSLIRAISAREGCFAAIFACEAYMASDLSDDQIQAVQDGAIRVGEIDHRQEVVMISAETTYGMWQCYHRIDRKIPVDENSPGVLTIGEWRENAIDPEAARQTNMMGLLPITDSN